MAVAVVRDITGLERLEQLRDELLTVAAHELKTPIATVKGYAQLLERWAPGGHTPREGAAFRVLQRQCDRMNRLVEELLELSRLEVEGQTLRRAHFDLAALLGEVLERMRRLSTEHAHAVLGRG
jgi:two-component system phosphate regulon sensor histidine kinase PhoR